MCLATRARLDVLRVLNTLRFVFQEFFATDAEELFEESCVAGVGFECGQDDVAHKGYEARGGRDGVVGEHFSKEPVGYPGIVG